MTTAATTRVSITTTTTTTTAPTRPAKSSTRRSWLPLSKASELTSKFLNPNFRIPPRPRIPTRPSLRASLLPPPCAELDERPRMRVRRFMLWKDKVPGLRVCLLDPRKKMHLRRFNIFQIPSNPQFTRGIRTVPGDLTTHPSYLFQKQTQGSHTPNEAGGNLEQNKGEVSPIVPLSMPEPTSHSSTSAPLTNLISHKAQARLQTTIAVPPKLERAPTLRPVQTMSPTGIVPAQAGGLMAPTSSSTIQSPPPVPSPVQQVIMQPTRAGGAMNARVRSTPQSRKAERARLLQHCFVLEQQAEKRYRSALRFLVLEMLDFQRENTEPMPVGSKQKPTWIGTPDIESIQRGIQCMKDIRASSRNMWQYFQNAPTPQAINAVQPVAGLIEAREKVKAARKKREDLKKVKAAKQRAAQEVKAAGALPLVSSPVPATAQEKQASAAASSDSSQVAEVKTIRRPVILLRRRHLPGADETLTSDPPQAQGQSRPLGLGECTTRRSSSGSSTSEHLLTPSTSQSSISLAPPRKRQNLQVQVNASSQNDDHTLDTGTVELTPDKLRSMGLDTEISDKIAHELAEMLSRYLAMGSEREKAKRAGRPDSARSNQGDAHSEQSSVDSVRTVQARRKGKIPIRPVTSIGTSEGSEFSSDESVCKRGHGTIRSWATGDMNKDEDTNALSGGGTSVGSPSLA